MDMKKIAREKQMQRAMQEAFTVFENFQFSIQEVFAILEAMTNATNQVAQKLEQQKPGVINGDS